MWRRPLGEVCPWDQSLIHFCYEQPRLAEGVDPSGIRACGFHGFGYFLSKRIRRAALARARVAGWDLSCLGHAHDSAATHVRFDLADASAHTSAARFAVLLKPRTVAPVGSDLAPGWRTQGGRGRLHVTRTLWRQRPLGSPLLATRFALTGNACVAGGSDRSRSGFPTCPHGRSLEKLGGNLGSSQLADSALKNRSSSMRSPSGIRNEASGDLDRCRWS